MIQEAKTKKCSKCRIIKPINEFGHNKLAKDNIQYYCKLCGQFYSKKFRQNNPLKIKKNQNQWYLNNPNYNHDYYLNNKTICLNNSKKYRTAHKKETNVKNKFKYQNNIEFRMIGLIRCRMRLALKNNQKHDRTMKLLGCSISKFWQHLEKQFQKGMTKENYGSNVGCWNLDHIIPCNIFNHDDPIEQQQCFHYTNYQPMWAIENYSKNDKIDHPSQLCKNMLLCLG